MKCRTKAVDLRLTLSGFYNSQWIKTTFFKWQYCSTNLSWSIQDLIQIYGQTAVFDHFVRNRHFSSRPFTDRGPIFIDLSVNGSDFVKYSTRSISAPSSQSNLLPNYFGLFPSWKCKASCIQKNRIRLQLIANHPVFQFETEFFPGLFLHFQIAWCFALKSFQIDPVAATQASEMPSHCIL